MVHHGSDVTQVLASLAGLLFVGAKSIASDTLVKKIVVHSISVHLRSAPNEMKTTSGCVEGLSECLHSFLSKLDGGENFIRQVGCVFYIALNSGFIFNFSIVFFILLKESASTF